MRIAVAGVAISSISSKSTLFQKSMMWEFWNIVSVTLGAGMAGNTDSLSSVSKKGRCGGRDWQQVRVFVCVVKDYVQESDMRIP